MIVREMPRRRYRAANRKDRMERMVGIMAVVIEVIVVMHEFLTERMIYRILLPYL